MKDLRKFFMEEFLESNRNIKFNLAESGMMARTLKDILNCLPPNAIDELTDISFADSPNWGREDLRELIAAMHPGAHYSNVLVTTGTSEALFLLFRQLKPKKIAMIFPAYQLLYEVPMQQGAELINLPVYWDNEGKPYFNEKEWFDIIKQSNPDVILINNPHNPTGLLLDKKILEGIVVLARQIGATIIADEHYRFLASETELLGHSLYRPDQKIFVTGSYMKCLGMSGIRVGWCVGPHKVLSAMQNEKVYTTHVVSPMTEWVSVKVLSECRDALFNQVRSEWLENKNIFQQFINNCPFILTNVPQGGLVTCVGFKGVTSVPGLTALLKKFTKQGLFALPLSTMELGKFQKKNILPDEIINGVRIGLGLKPELFKEGLAILQEILLKTFNKSLSMA